MSDVSEKPAEEAAEQEPEFAIVEVFGHRKHAGRIYEVERFGAKMLRVDVPKEGDFAKGFTTLFYGGASIFSMAPCDLATVARVNKPYEPASRLTYDPDNHPGDDEEIIF